MPQAKCPGCGYEEPFHPRLNNPRNPITEEEWWRRLKARFGPETDADSVLPLYCAECLDKRA